MVNRSTDKSSDTQMLAFFSQLQEISELLEQLKKHKRKWSTFKHINGFYFGMAISVATVILKNAQFNVVKIKDDGESPLIGTIQFTKGNCQFKLVQSEQEKTFQKLGASFTEAIPRMLELIENILYITKDTNTTEKSKDQVVDCMMDLVAFAREKNLVDFNKFKPEKGGWQHTRLIKSLDTIT